MFLFQTNMSTKKVVSDRALKKFMKDRRKITTNIDNAEENHQNTQCTEETIVFAQSVFPKNVRRGISKFAINDKRKKTSIVEPKSRVGLSCQPVSVSIPVAFCVIQLYSFLLCFARHRV